MARIHFNSIDADIDVEILSALGRLEEGRDVRELLGRQMMRAFRPFIVSPCDALQAGLIRGPDKVQDVATPALSKIERNQLRPAFVFAGKSKTTDCPVVRRSVARGPTTVFSRFEQPR